MKHSYALVALLFSGLTLAACSQPAPPAPPAASSADKGLIGRHVEKAIAEARAELRKQNIDVSGVDININGKKIARSDANLPKAEITPQGDLLIDGQAVTIDAEQRKQLLTYRDQIIGIAEAGMAIGAQGADLAGKALSGAVGAIFGGKDGEKELEQKMEAEGRKIEAEAVKLCAYMPAMLASQQSLAASLPAFKPYATMTQEDIDDCGKDGKGHGVAVTDAERDQIRDDIRNNIREGIRGSVQAATTGTAEAKDAEAPATR